MGPPAGPTQTGVTCGKSNIHELLKLFNRHSSLEKKVVVVESFSIIVFWGKKQISMNCSS